MLSFGDFIGTIGMSFSLYPLAYVLQPYVRKVLKEHNQDTWREGTKLIPPLVLWLVLGLVIRRDKKIESVLSHCGNTCTFEGFLTNAYSGAKLNNMLLLPQCVLSWLLSGYRWLYPTLEPETHLVAEGSISHARKRLGFQIFIDLFKKIVGLSEEGEADFHGRRSVIFDGTTASMPDTEKNRKEVTKPGSRKGESAYPRMRIMVLIVLNVRMILDLAYAPYRGKKTGEKNLVRNILSDLTQTNLLFLMDAGLYAFDILWNMQQKQSDFLIKVPNTVKNLRPIRSLEDGSYIVHIYGKILDVHAPPTPQGRQTWLHECIEVRIIPVEIPGFRPFLLMTTVLEPQVTALELAKHYHRRWDVEIAYDEIKTHLCVTLRGQAPTTFRSKSPALVIQELYALAIVYNTVRYIICQAVSDTQDDPCNISFLEALSHIIDAVPILSHDAASPQHRQAQWLYLKQLIASCYIDRPRRKRAAPRAVKIKMSKFNRKQPDDRSEAVDYDKNIRIVSYVFPKPANA